MTSYHRCIKCNSDRMMDGVYVADALYEAYQRVDQSREASRAP